MTDIYALSYQGLIRTKYGKPVISQYLVSRQFLYEKLGQSIKHKLTIISAPAGYGKTTAVAGWLEEAGLISAWVLLDQKDNDPVLFWKYITAALDGIAGGIGKDTSYVFSSQELFKANIHLSIIIDKLTSIKRDFILVLDDFHLITDHNILESLSYFIGFMPPQMHIVLISRTEPGPEISKFDVKGHSVRIKPDDLRFNEEEISKFYEARGLFLENDDIKRVENYTEGWAAALVAVAMSIKDNTGRCKTINSLKSCDRKIERYLQKEVLSMWNEEVQAFLLRTSILDKFCGPLCDEVTGFNSSCKLLAEISEQNSFLISMDDENYWYRYHSLFADFLHKRLIDTDYDCISGLHEKAAGWYKANGFVYQAVEHYLHACLYEEAAKLIEEHVSSLIRKGDYSTIILLIERLPGEFIENSLEIVAGLVFYYTEIGAFEQAEKWMTKLETVAEEYRYKINDIDRKYAKKVCVLIKANLVICQGDLDRFLLLIQEATEIKDVSVGFDKDFFNINRFDIYIYRNPMNRILQLMRIDSKAFLSFIKNYRSLIGKNPGYAPLLAGEYYYENNRLEEAEQYLIASINEALKADCPGAFVPAMVNVARIKKAKGDIQGAFEAVGECEYRVKKFCEPHWEYILSAFKALLYIESGETEKAENWMSSSKLRLFQEITKMREFELIVFARVLIVKRHFDDAGMLLKRLLIFAGETARLHSMVEILNLLSITAYEKGETATAMFYLEKALSIGVEEYYIRSFADELEPMAMLLEIFLKPAGKQADHKNEDRLTVYAQMLLKYTNDSIRAMAAVRREEYPDGAIKLLTTQEQKVLRLLVDAYTNNEIAQEINVTLRTVKAHISSIYSKMGVKNRAQCIKLVRESGMLEGKRRTEYF